MSDKKCPKDEKCKIELADSERKLPSDKMYVELITPRYRCKVCGKYFYERELI